MGSDPSPSDSSIRRKVAWREVFPYHPHECGVQSRPSPPSAFPNLSETPDSEYVSTSSSAYWSATAPSQIPPATAASEVLKPSRFSDCVRRNGSPPVKPYTSPPVHAASARKYQTPDDAASRHIPRLAIIVPVCNPSQTDLHPLLIWACKRHIVDLAGYPLKGQTSR